jgi:hypothetical protein
VPQDFKRHYEEQLTFLRSSCDAYDAGVEPEAKRLAVTLRILLHDTRRSTSLLTHLGIKEKIPFVNTGSPERTPGAIVVFDGGLCVMRKSLGTGEATRFVPVLDTDRERNQHPPMCFSDWWETPVLTDNEGNEFTRKDFVWDVANKDGGAHIDAKLRRSYEALTRGNSMRLTTDREVTEDGWEVVMGGTFGGPELTVEEPTRGEPLAGSIALASIRQIAHEIALSLSAVEWDESGGDAEIANPICGLPLRGLDLSRIRASTGRNDLCPCGSGRKFKRCLEAKLPRPVRL